MKNVKMKNVKRKKKAGLNPYLTSYLSFGILCCIALSILFLSINVQNMKRDQQIHDQEKVSLVVDDIGRQMDTFRKIYLQISVNKIYQPYYFKMNKYYEMTLLNDFEQYKNYSAISEECFLFYEGDSRLFCTSGYTASLDTYLNTLGSVDAGILKYLLGRPEQVGRIVHLKDKIYLMMSMKVSAATGEYGSAVLCFVIRDDLLESRFQTVSGGLKGSLWLYSGPALLYTNSKNGEITEQEARLVRSETTEDGSFTVSYLPEGRGFSGYNLFPVQMLLILAVIIFVLMIASIFAHHSYKPIQAITKKYRHTMPVSEEVPFRNELEEINYMMDSVLKSNIMANTQLEQKQELLRRQILQLLINGRYSSDLKPYLEQLKVFLPGPYFFVMSISFGSGQEPDETFYTDLKKLLDQMSEPGEKKYVYALKEYEQRHLYVICSVEEKEKSAELTESIQDLAESFEYSPVVGVGNVYSDLSRLSASYLEALDNVHRAGEDKADGLVGTQSYVYDQTELYRIYNALSCGEEEAAVQALQHYIQTIENGKPSLLMQQYIFTNFLSEVTRAARDYQIELSHQSLSLIISAKNVKDFKEAAEALIHDFCSCFISRKNQIMENENYRVFQYVNDHFADYNLSIEKAAGDLGTNAAFIRKAIREQTGKNYKDYLIYLRIEYAKTLLTRENLTVAETCEKVGYGNISYFIKAFKTMTGVTPANYKNSCR